MTTPPTEIKHPAKFSRPILDEIAAMVLEELQRVEPQSVKILDPFAGTGLIHTLSNIDPRVRTFGVEIEPEWAAMGPPCLSCNGAGGGWVRHGQDPSDFDHEDCKNCGGTGSRTFVGNALHLPGEWTSTFHIVATSPTYGNRMADHHNARDSSRRMTYKHVLGRDLHPDNSGAMHWGEKYWEFHQEAWREVTRVLKQPLRTYTMDEPPPAPDEGVGLVEVNVNTELTYPGGLFILNVSDFIRNGKVIEVCQWHYDTIIQMGYDLEYERDVPTARLRYGANHSARVTHEKIFVFRRTMNR